MAEQEQDIVVEARAEERPGQQAHARGRRLEEGIQALKAIRATLVLKAYRVIEDCRVLLEIPLLNLLH